MYVKRKKDFNYAGRIARKPRRFSLISFGCSPSFCFSPGSVPINNPAFSQTPVTPGAPPIYTVYPPTYTVQVQRRNDAQTNEAIPVEPPSYSSVIKFSRSVGGSRTDLTVDNSNANGNPITISNTNAVADATTAAPNAEPSANNV
jgi:hypothetical protein